MPNRFDRGIKGFGRGRSRHNNSDGDDTLGHDPNQSSSRSMAPDAEDISENERLYRLALTPISTHTGYPYPCRQEDLDSYSRKKKSTLFGEFLRDIVLWWPESIDAVIRDIEAYLDPDRPPSAEERSAMDRLYKALCLKGGEWTPDVPIKAFRDLDTVFFQGRLSGNVKVGWVRSTQITTPNSIGTTIYRFNGQSEIALDADYHIFEAQYPWKSMWQTLIHEMVVSNR
ncbi:MAG: hypothetical protein Q9167_002643 [Letrouitia subvulpina]